MKKSIEVNWKGGMAFETMLDGHKLVIDAVPEVGGKDLGPRPKVLMLVALGGCTGMDVVSMLKKMRVEVEKFSMRIDGNITEEHPKHFDNIRLVYSFTGDNLSRQKIEKAVNMSIEKYCGVSAVYRKAMDLNFEIEINDK